MKSLFFSLLCTGLKHIICNLNRMDQCKGWVSMVHILVIGLLLHSSRGQIQIMIESSNKVYNNNLQKISLLTYCCFDCFWKLVSHTLYYLFSQPIFILSGYSYLIFYYVNRENDIKHKSYVKRIKQNASDNTTTTCTYLQRKFVLNKGIDKFPWTFWKTFHRN